MLFRSSDNLHLKLAGTLDCESVKKLIKVIKKYSLDVNAFYIHTCGLTSVASDAATLFLRHCVLANIPTSRIIATGDFSDHLLGHKAATLPKAPSQYRSSYQYNGDFDEYAINLSAIPKNNCHHYNHLISR